MPEEIIQKINNNANNLTSKYLKINNPIILMIKINIAFFLDGSLNPEISWEGEFIHKGHNKVINAAHIAYIYDVSLPKTDPKK